MNLTSLFLFAGFFFSLGLATAVLVMRLQKEDEKAAAETGKEHQPSEPAHQVEGQRREVTRLWRSKEDDHIIVEIDGRVVEFPFELNIIQQEKLKHAASDLQSWLVMTEPPPAKNSFPQTPTSAEQRAPSSISPASTPQAPIPSLSNVSQVTPIKPLPNPIGVFMRALDTATHKTHEQPRSIAIQIDEILQQRLINTPLEQHTIRILELPNFGVVFNVDGREYASAEDIPDEAVRNAIHAATNEWQRRMSTQK